MATFNYTYTIANGQKADATPVQQNLNDARTFMLNSCWHTDGVNGFSQNCVVFQNTEMLVPANAGTTFMFDGAAQNAFSIWSGTSFPYRFTCNSTGYYAIHLTEMRLDVTRGFQVPGYVAFQNVTTAAIFWKAGDVAGSSACTASWLLFLTAGEVFQVLAYHPTLASYVTSANLGIVQVGR